MQLCPKKKKKLHAIAISRVPGIETLNPHAHVFKLMSCWVSHFKGFKHEPNGLKKSFTRIKIV